jgi:hypothetical protein
MLLSLIFLVKLYFYKLYELFLDPHIQPGYIYRVTLAQFKKIFDIEKKH